MPFSPRCCPRLRFVPLLLLALAGGCASSRVVRDPIYSSDTARVYLRRTVEGGAPVARGYAHPATVSDVRLAHILASLEHEDGGKRAVTVPSELVYELAEALNKAAVQATPDDEIAALVYLNDRRFGLFTNRKVTSFRAYFTEQELIFEFYDIARPLEAGESKTGQAEYDVPLEAAQTRTFRMIPGQSQTAAGARSLRVVWRDPYYAQPIALSVREGRFKRRTVVSEASEPKTETAAPPPPLDSDPARRDAQLRALDQLDAARRSGIVTEAEFQNRRRLILEGKLEEAGYGTAP
jgi:hypothetical protein